MSVTQSEKLDALAVALVKAQAQVKGAVKDSTNPFFKSKYADLASVWDACREALTANGLSVTQFPGYEAGEPGVATLTTVLLHSSGQWMQGTAGAPLPDQTRRDGSVEKANAQGIGSAITYLRRYALAAVAGVVQEDDDGQAASQPVKRPVAKQPEQPLTEKPRQLTEEPLPPWDPPEAAVLASDFAAPPAWRKTWPFGSLKGRALHTMTSEELVAQKNWAMKAGKALDLVDTMDEILASRQGL